MEKCKTKVWRGYQEYQCSNSAKYGGFCGIHSPEKREERAAKRGPTQAEQDLSRIGARENELIRLRAQLARTNIDCGCGEHHWVCHPCMYVPSKERAQARIELLEAALVKADGLASSITVSEDLEDCGVSLTALSRYDQARAVTKEPQDPSKVLPDLIGGE